MARPEQEMGKDTAAEKAGPSFGSPADGNDPFGIAGWFNEVPKVLMQHPAAAMAAVATIGLGMTSHFAGFMLGTLQGMAETAQKTAAADDDRVAKVAEPVAAPAVAVRQDAPETVRREDKAPVDATPVKAEKPKRQKVAARLVETPADDLKRISGIGPKLEQVLNGKGIRRYADVALWSDKDVQHFDEQLGFGGRIARDGWVEQAKALMKGRV